MSGLFLNRVDFFRGKLLVTLKKLEAMLFKGMIGCIYRSLKGMCLTSAKFISRSTRTSHAVMLIQTKLEVIPSSGARRRQITMTCAQKLYNPPSCVAWGGQMTMFCGQKAKFPSCVARRSLQLHHAVMICYQDKTQPSNKS